MGRLQAELGSKSLWAQFSEWCDTPDARAKGFVFKDCCVLFDTKEGKVEFLDQRAPDHNIYRGTPWPILGAADEDAIKRCQSILK